MGIHHAPLQSARGAHQLIDLSLQRHHVEQGHYSVRLLPPTGTTVTDLRADLAHATAPIPRLTAIPDDLAEPWAVR